MTSILLSVLLWINIFSCAGVVQVAPAQTEQASPAHSADAESDAVYRVIVDWRVAHPGEGPRAEQLVLLDTTVPYSCLGIEEKDCPSDIRKRLPGMLGGQAAQDTVDDFLRRNSSQGPLSRTIPADISQVFMSPSEEQKLFRAKSHDGWQLFYKKFPHAGGITAFSRVGFNATHDQAILYSQISCGWLCGTGHYHLLKKESGKWVLLGSYMAWIS